MKKIILAAAITTLMTSAAFAQANPNAPQPGSAGIGINQPATSPTGVAIDRPDSVRRIDGETTGMNYGTRRDVVVEPSTRERMSR